MSIRPPFLFYLLINCIGEMCVVTKGFKDKNVKNQNIGFPDSIWTRVLLYNTFLLSVTNIGLK